MSSRFCLLVSLLLLTGCSSLFRGRVETRYVHDTLSVHTRDSVYFRDSIYIREWMKGDTVYVDRWHDRYFYKDRWRDSLVLREVHDTTTVERKVEKELSRSQKAKIGSFWWLVLAVVGLGAWTCRKPIAKLLKTILT